MDNRRYYNRYQRPMPSVITQRQLETNDGYGECSINASTLAMVYARAQKFEQIYDLTSALNYGTIFKCLNMPFSGKRC